jgi:hypothetical protein
MPFDGTNLGAPSLRTLADVLRDQSRWPAGFNWDYRDTHNCGIGLAQRLWGRRLPLWEIPGQYGVCIFVNLHHHLGIAQHQVQPEHVADAIDAYLSRRDH